MLSETPRSANDLLRAVPVPQSTLYRRLGELKELGLVGVQRSILTEDGKKVDLFRSLLEEVDITLRGSSMSVRSRRRDLAAERLADLWGEVRDQDGHQ
jgi:DNA-binding IclR family transcriptional regulator